MLIYMTGKLRTHGISQFTWIEIVRHLGQEDLSEMLDLIVWKNQIDWNLLLHFLEIGQVAARPEKKQD